MAKTVIYNNGADTTALFEVVEPQIGLDDDAVIAALKVHLSENLSTSGAGNVTDVENLQEFIMRVVNRARSADPGQ